MEKLKTATGKEFDCDYFNPAPVFSQINLRVLNITVAEAATIFSDPKETVQLWFENVYVAQHTKLIAIVPEADAIRVVLGKE